MIDLLIGVAFPVLWIGIFTLSPFVLGNRDIIAVAFATLKAKTHALS